MERTYAALGSVYRTYFGEWWLTTAQFCFGVSATPKAQTLLRLDHRQVPEEAMVDQARTGLDRYLAAERPAEGLPAALVIAIPVSRDRRRVLREVAALIDREFGPEHQEQGITAAKLIDNKMRERTLVMAMRVLPALTPALLAGFGAALASGVGEYGSVIFIAGNMPMVSEIAPLLIVIRLEQLDYAGAASLGLAMLAISFGVLLTINRLQRRMI